MPFESMPQPSQQPTPQEMAAQQAAAAAPELLGLTPAEQMFMDKAGMTPEQLAQYKRWKKLDEELGGKPALH